jgi:hypothetical protein
VTRAEHIAWCKQRALEYVDRGDLNQALASMLSDLGKHSETANHPAAGLALPMVMLPGSQSIVRNPAAMRKWIEGFN